MCRTAFAMVLRYAHDSGGHVDAAMKALDRTLPEPAAPKENDSSTQLTHELQRATGTAGAPVIPLRPKAGR
jgi:hypothetical protein